MIIYGTRSPKINTVKSPTSICPNCQNQFTLSYTIYRKHVHIFWIPLFPLKKKGLSECSNCKSLLNEKEMPEKLRAELQSIKSETKGPIWQFIGLVLILILGIWIYIHDGKKTEEEIAFLEAPQIGDVYDYKIQKGSYSTMKIVDLKEDSIFVVLNEYESNKSLGLSKIDKSDNYSDEVLTIAKSEIMELHTEGDLLQVHRNIKE